MYKADLSHIEVSGSCILPFISAMGIFADKGREMLEDCGIMNPVENGWYPIENWLKAIDTVEKKIGPATLKQTAFSLMSDSPAVPGLTLEKAFEIMDLMYHSTHKKDGVIMYDPRAGSSLEGIGNFKYIKTGDRTAEIISDTPYPCLYETAAITGLGRRYKPHDSTVVFIDHEPNAGCRKNGGKSCTYLISW